MELRECPFCGSIKAKVWSFSFDGCKTEFYDAYVECRDCACQGPYVGNETDSDLAEQKAAELWNTRKE